MSRGSRVDPVKVVIINTQYVQTDAMSFKSVVQRLTGKDSKIEMEPSFDVKEQTRYQAGVNLPSHDPVMSRGLSFKDFDRLFKELPPLEELYMLYAD